MKGQIAERIKLVPRLTWKLQVVPFGADQPYTRCAWASQATRARRG